jgi:4-oxalocrotonate tautomerase
MPILQVKISRHPDSKLGSIIAEGLLERTTRILHKKRNLTSIALEYVSPESWIVGGSSLAAQGKNSFYLEIKVVAGTNTKDELAAYIADCFTFFGAVLGDVHNESYIYVQEVKADAYGFGGVTQERRYIEGNALPAH